MNIEACEKFFLSGTRSAGSRLYKEGKLRFSMPSSLEIIAYVKPAFKVSLKLDSLQSGGVKADCNCPASKKAQLCKHIFASFLAVFEKSPEFFETVEDIIKPSLVPKTTKPRSEAQITAEATFKLKQETYRKQQYQKQKARLKEFKHSKGKGRRAPTAFPRGIEDALTYFSKNGFSLENSLNENSILSARKKLARIFHPDVGGSHTESLELNNYSEILLNYLRKL